MSINTAPLPRHQIRATPQRKKSFYTSIGIIFFNFLKPYIRLQTPCSSSLYTCRISSHNSLSSSLLLSKTKGALRHRCDGAPWNTHSCISTFEGRGFSRGREYPRPECRLLRRLGEPKSEGLPRRLCGTGGMRGPEEEAEEAEGARDRRWDMVRM